MASKHPRGFTAHNVRLDDGSYTLPQAVPIEKTGNYLCVRMLLALLFPDGWQGRSIVDLGCLEGGYATEFARLGLEATGIEIRAGNIANAEYVRSRTNLPNLRFVQDDAWNVGNHGMFDLVFCVGLHYHIDNQLEFMRTMSASCRRAIFIDTHLAPDSDSEPAVGMHSLSGLTVHEGLPGRWYPEHDLTIDQSSHELEQLKWASWRNKRSFWPTKGSLVHTMRAAGFPIVFQDFGNLCGDVLRELSPQGWSFMNNRSMFVGVKPLVSDPS